MPKDKDTNWKDLVAGFDLAESGTSIWPESFYPKHIKC